MIVQNSHKKEVGPITPGSLSLYLRTPEGLLSNTFIMPMTSKTDHHLNLNHLPPLSATLPKSGSSTANTSPIEPPPGIVRSPFGHPNGMSTMNGGSNTSRLGAGSPSHELGSRLYTKR